MMSMKSRSRVTFLLAVTVMIAVAGSGCIAILGGAVGAGTIVYMKGESIRTYDYPMSEVAIAAQKTFVDLDISATETSITQLDSSLQGEMADGTKVSLKLISKAEKATEVRVRVGMIGDENSSQRIHEQILKNLK